MTQPISWSCFVHESLARRALLPCVQVLWNSPPLLVMNNFGGGGHLKLATVRPRGSCTLSLLFCSCFVVWFLSRCNPPCAAWDSLAILKRASIIRYGLESTCATASVHVQRGRFCSCAMLPDLAAEDLTAVGTAGAVPEPVPDAECDHRSPVQLQGEVRPACKNPGQIFSSSCQKLFWRRLF